MDLPAFLGSQKIGVRILGNTKIILLILVLGTLPTRSQGMFAANVQAQQQNPIE